MNAIIETVQDALHALDAAWPQICEECLSVLGSELHYQAMIYHALRTSGRVPSTQLGMNVKQWIPNVQSELFKRLDVAKAPGYQGGFEPIPDVVIFSPAVNGDWRRRRRDITLACMLVAIEVKASERAGKRLSLNEITRDILKLAAHREEAAARGFDFSPVMMVLDTAPEDNERMRSHDITTARELAEKKQIGWRYLSPKEITP